MTRSQRQTSKQLQPHLCVCVSARINVEKKSRLCRVFVCQSQSCSVLLDAGVGNHVYQFYGASRFYETFTKKLRNFKTGEEETENVTIHYVMCTLLTVVKGVKK